MEEGRRLSREAIERALALNPNLAAAHAQMGRIKQQVDYDWAGADASFQRAVALEPANAENMGFAAWSAAIFGRFDEALELNRRAANLDPQNADSWGRLASAECCRGGRRMHCVISNAYNTLPLVRLCMRLRTTRLVGKRSRTPH